MIIILPLRLSKYTFDLLYIFYYGLASLKLFDLSSVAKLNLIKLESRINDSSKKKKIKLN